MSFNYPLSNFISPRSKIPIREYHVSYNAHTWNRIECNEIKLIFQFISIVGERRKPMVG